jgi:hypothetical protein
VTINAALVRHQRCWIRRAFALSWTPRTAKEARTVQEEGGMMDRNLEIALVSAALVVAMGYGISQRLLEGYTAIKRTTIRRVDEPKAFWLIIGTLILTTMALATLSVVYFARWTSN